MQQLQGEAAHLDIGHYALPVMSGAKDPDQDCDMVTALDRDALTPTELKFLEAARTNRCNILSSILARPNFNINVKTNLNRTALHMAASQGNLEAVQLLVKAKILIDTVDKHGMTPLFWAAFKDQVNVVLYLLQRGAEPGRRTKRGYSLLHVIAKADAIKTMEALLRRKKITNLTEYDNDDMTPLMIAASSGSILATTVLSKLGHIEDHIDQHQRNLLHLAVLSGSPDVVAVLCQNPTSSALINEFDEDGMTPLQYAVRDLNYDCVEILLAHEAKPNLKSPKSTFPLITAAQKGDLEMVRILISGKAGIKKKNRSGNTPLHIASMANHVSVVMELLQLGADIEIRNKRLQPPLLAAVEQNSADAAEVLLLAGADMNKVDASAKTALSLAAQSGFARIVDLLIKADRFRTKHPDLASAMAKALRGVAEETDSSDSISETETFIGSLSPSEFEQRTKEAGVVLINDQIVVLGSQANGRVSKDNGTTSEKSESSEFSISQATTYNSCESEALHSKTSLSPPPTRTPAAVNSQAGSGLSNGRNAKANQWPAAKTNSLASSTLPGKEVNQSVEQGSTTAAGPPSQEVPSVPGSHHEGAGTQQPLPEDSRSREVCAASSTRSKSGWQPAAYVVQKSPASMAGSGRPTHTSELEYRLLNFNQPFAAQFQPLLYYLAYNKLHREEWKKLAVFWRFTDEQIAAIELHHAQSAKAYKDHGFRMLCIWLHGVEADETPVEELYAALIAIGRKARADKLQQDYHKVFHGHKNWKHRLEVPLLRKRR
uniref:Death domain-containing protein n=1 Tax=Schistocephalus solidus TaxID=70667 RepID=A0A0X3PQ03_SCHSO